jgi:hypothetical protein
MYANGYKKVCRQARVTLMVTGLIPVQNPEPLEDPSPPEPS